MASNEKSIKLIIWFKFNENVNKIVKNQNLKPKNIFYGFLSATFLPRRICPCIVPHYICKKKSQLNNFKQKIDSLNVH